MESEVFLLSLRRDSYWLKLSTSVEVTVNVSVPQCMLGISPVYHHCWITVHPSNNSFYFSYLFFFVSTIFISNLTASAILLPPRYSFYSDYLSLQAPRKWKVTIFETSFYDAWECMLDVSKVILYIRVTCNFFRNWDCTSRVQWE